MADEGPDINFWRGRYADGNTPWDLGEPSGPVIALVREHFPPQGRVLVPACGRGYEALYLAGKGYAVTAVDYVTEPIRFLRETALAKGLTVELLEQDIFDLPAALDGGFDVLLEQTCLCAIRPGQWENYEALARRMLTAGGRLLGVFMEMEGAGGPPYDCPPDKVRALFDNPHWSYEGMERMPDNPARPGPEYTARFRREK